MGDEPQGSHGHYAADGEEDLTAFLGGGFGAFLGCGDRGVCAGRSAGDGGGHGADLRGAPEAPAEETCAEHC